MYLLLVTFRTVSHVLCFAAGLIDKAPSVAMIRITIMMMMAIMLLLLLLLMVHMCRSQMSKYTYHLIKVPTWPIT